MSIISYLKALFIKELEDIVAPLDKIKTNIDKFVQKQEANIEKDAAKVKTLLQKNEARVANNLKASTIIKNLNTLLGVN